jgi:hypothetical protein
MPGIKYQINYRYYDDVNLVWNMDPITIYAILPLPAEQLTTYWRDNVTFILDECFTDATTNTRLSAFMSKTNRAFSVFQDFIGGDEPNIMTITHDRSLDATNYEGISGYPIQWATAKTMKHLIKMNYYNVDLTETPLHEIAHNFTSWKWNFETEALACFLTYYYFDNTGYSFVVGSQSQVFSGGSGFKTYMKSYANRLLGQINYDASIPNGILSPYGLAYNLAEIAEEIGWEPFEKTFRYFYTLYDNKVPDTDIGKFNLFLTMLSTYSGQNVFNMFTAQEKAVYGAALCGTVAPETFDVGLMNHWNKSYTLLTSEYGAVFMPYALLAREQGDQTMASLRLDYHMALTAYESQTYSSFPELYFNVNVTADYISGDSLIGAVEPNEWNYVPTIGYPGSDHMGGDNTNLYVMTSMPREILYTTRVFCDYMTLPAIQETTWTL